MHSKRKWLPSWQRIELVELCVEHGLTRRQAAAWRRASVSTVQYWVGRWQTAARLSARTGPGRWIGPRRRTVVRRFEWPCPGDLLQMDTKRLACFSRPGHKVTGNRFTTGAEKRERVGYEFCHSIIDDHTRIAYTEIHPDENAETVTAFLARALAFYGGLGVTARRLQTDNAWAYVKNRSLRELLIEHEISHRRIPPRTPKRNGKEERYQQTLAREWAYGQRYRNSTARTQALPIWLDHYNYVRNHSSLSNRPPMTRLVRNDPRHNN